MAHVMARFGPGSTEIYRDVLDQNQGKNGGFPPFCRWFSDVVEQEKWCPEEDSNLHDLAIAST